MSLGLILTDIASLGGVDLQDSNQLTAVTFRVNKAAREIYEQTELIGSLREQVFQMTTQHGDQFTMPEYVGQVKAVRYFYPEYNLRTVDMRPRFKSKFWQVQNFMSWRLKEQIPTIKEVANASKVMVQFRGSELTPITVTLSGSTEDADNVIENITIPVGQNTPIQSVNAFLSYTAITKSAPTQNNCDVWDLDGNLLTTIPNSQLKALYQLVQIVNMPNGSIGAAQYFQPISDYVEVLWKMKWRPMVTPQDEFLCPGYDAAIFWKYMEHKARISPQTSFDANQAEKFKAQCDAIIAHIAEQNDENLEKSLNFGTNAVYDAFEQIGQRKLHGDASRNHYDGAFTLWP